MKGQRPSQLQCTIGDLAKEIQSRLLRDGDEAAVADPIGYLDRVATQVESQWNRRVLHQSLDDNLDARCSIHSALESLTGAERYLIGLHIRHGFTYSEIATRLRISDGVVLRSLIRAYVTLVAADHDDHDRTQLCTE